MLIRVIVVRYPTLIGLEAMPKRATLLSKCLNSSRAAIRVPDRMHPSAGSASDPTANFGGGLHQRVGDEHRLVYMADLIAELAAMARDGGFEQLSSLLAEADAEARIQIANAEP